MKKNHYYFQVLSEEHIILEGLLSNLITIDNEMIQQQQNKQGVV